MANDASSRRVLGALVVARKLLQELHRLEQRLLQLRARGDFLARRRRALVPDGVQARAKGLRLAPRRRRLFLALRGAFARGRRQTSYEKLHELADWKRIGLHKKYADATMVRARSSRSSTAPVASARILFLLVRVPSRLTRPPRPSPRPPSRAR